MPSVNVTALGSTPALDLGAEGLRPLAFFTCPCGHEAYAAAKDLQCVCGATMRKESTERESI